MSDLLLQYGEMQTPVAYDVLRRKEVLPGKLLHSEREILTNCCMVLLQFLAISDSTSLFHNYCITLKLNNLKLKVTFLCAQVTRTCRNLWIYLYNYSQYSYSWKAYS